MARFQFSRGTEGRRLNAVFVFGHDCNNRLKRQNAFINRLLREKYELHCKYNRYTVVEVALQTMF